MNNLTQALRTHRGLRIFCCLAAASLVAGLALYLLFYRVQEEQTLEDLRGEARDLAALLAQDLRAGGLGQGRLPALPALSRSGLIALCLYSDRGELLSASENPVAAGSGADQGCQPRQPRELTDRQSIAAAVSIDPSGENTGSAPALGTLLVQLSTAKLVERRQSLQRQGTALFFIFLAILGALTLAVVKEATRPLKQLLVRLRRKLPPANAETSDIDFLEQTFSTMLSELENSFKTIESLRDHLGKKVEQRTWELQRINANLEKTVSELKEAQMQLIHSEKMASLGLLATGLAHEINNSLGVIKGSFFPLRKAIDRLQANGRPSPAGDKDPAETAVVEIFHHIDTGIFRITSLLRDLMTFARPGIASKKPVDINNELEMTLRLLDVATSKNIEFIKDFSPIHPVLCHESQIAQVFFNILLNAIQAFDQQGCIRIRTAVEGDYVVIVFADNGMGIAPEILDKIFDPFFTTKDTGAGTGLGLSICYAIINEHGGSIGVRSEVGKGTVFTIKLPRHPSGNAGTTGSATAGGQASRASAGR